MMEGRGILDSIRRMLSGRTDTSDSEHRRIEDKEKRLNRELNRLEALGVEVEVRGRLSEPTRDSKRDRTNMDNGW